MQRRNQCFTEVVAVAVTVTVFAVTAATIIVTSRVGLAARPPRATTVAVLRNKPTRARLTVEHASAAQTVAIDTAVQRFADAHLALPELTIGFSDDPSACDGYLGTFETATTPWTIAICSDLAFVPTHELAHAWLEANVDAETRARYLRSRRIERWDDKQDDWSARGVEDAAFIIQQNLMITPPTPLTAEWQSRADAYEVLTGHSSPLRRIELAARPTRVESPSLPRPQPPGKGRRVDPRLRRHPPSAPT